MSLATSLVFEQSSGKVGGDNASSAELYALLSANAELPITQSLIGELERAVGPKRTMRSPPWPIVRFGYQTLHAAAR